MSTSPRPVEIGPIVGSAPSGSEAPIGASRSFTWLRAKYMSVPSSKIAVTWLKPLREIERVISSPSIPASPVSMGKVTCVSTCEGESAGALVLICTCVFVMSGTASIGRRKRFMAP